MKLASTYITTEKFDETVEFYKKILQQEPDVFSENRWIEFSGSTKISIYNKEYDKKLISESPDLEKHFNKAFLDAFSNEEVLSNNCVIFNFYCEDLMQEYNRIKNFNFTTSDIMYVNIREPYWYFNLYDPNNNILEITGPYNEY